MLNQALSGRSRRPDYGLRTSPIAWETERDNSLKSLSWTHDKLEFRLLPCSGSPCLWSTVLFKPGDDPHVKTSGGELTQGVVITHVHDLLIAGWQHHIDAITQALLAKYVMKHSGSLQYGDSEDRSSGIESEGIGCLRARTTRNVDGTVWCDQSKYILHCLRENGLVGADGLVSLKKTHIL